MEVFNLLPESGVVKLIYREPVKFYGSCYCLARLESVQYIPTKSVARGKLRAVRNIDTVEGQISEHAFTPHESYCVYYPSNIFCNTHCIENLG